MGDSNRAETFEYVARELGRRRLAFIWAREYLGPDRLGARLKAAFGGIYVANEKFDLHFAQQVVADGEADAVSFGQLFIDNPDLPARFRIGAAPNPARREGFYAGGAEGYTDYPALA